MLEKLCFKININLTKSKYIRNLVLRRSVFVDGEIVKQITLAGIIIKKVLEYITRPLAVLITMSFCTGHFPIVLKKGKVTPIYRKGDPSLIIIDQLQFRL